MAISDVKEYTHLSEEQVEELGRELDAIRAEIEESRGAADAAYINRMITIQRRLAAAGRVTLFASKYKPAFFAGTAMLGIAKILENMEIGHNVMHGQWDWMNDPEIHSSNWEWDTAQPAEQWKHSHNYVHHQFTNVLGHDNDIGYGVLRMAREQRWHPVNLGQPVYNAMLALLFQWGVALHDLDLEAIRKRRKDPKEMKRQLKQIGRKVRRQFAKDYVVYPLLAGPNALSTMKANAIANLMRNVWSYTIIFCGHFPDGALHFTEEEIEDETRAEWYLRQMLGSANFSGGPLLHILSRQPGLPDRAPPVPGPAEQPLRGDLGQGAGVCERYGIPYTTGPLHNQYGQVLRTIHKLALPNRMTSDDAPSPPSRRSPRAPADRRRAADPPRSRPGRGRRAGRREGRTTGTVDLSERRHDLRHDVPVPFASDPHAGYGVDHRQEPTGPADLGAVVKARAIQCALSRICGLCGKSLRPVVRPHDVRGLARGGGGQHVRVPADARGLRRLRARDLPAARRAGPRADARAARSGRSW